MKNYEEAKALMDRLVSEAQGESSFAVKWMLRFESNYIVEAGSWLADVEWFDENNKRSGRCATEADPLEAVTKLVKSTPWAGRLL
jgi:hypothetical protein